MIHYHTYSKTPKMNAYVERFNRIIQDDFIDWRLYELKNPDEFNRLLIDYLIFCSAERAHCAFQNELSPIQQFMVQRQKQRLLQEQLQNQSINQLFKIPLEFKIGWHYITY